MELQTITNILLALTLAHTFHSLGEVKNIREKIKRLEAYIDKKSYKEIPVKIDTRLKGIGLGYGLVVVIFLIFLVVVSMIDPASRTAIVISIGLLVAVELINTVTIDAYHAEIEKVTKRFKK